MKMFFGILFMGSVSAITIVAILWHINNKE